MSKGTMDELITALFEITERMEHALREANDQEFEQLVTERRALMDKVDEYRSKYPNESYSQSDKRLLEDALHLDQWMASFLKEQMLEVKTSLNQIKKNKKISKKFQPYIKQTNGVFIDSKK